MRGARVSLLGLAAVVACGDGALTTVGTLSLDPPAATTAAGRAVTFTPHLTDGDVELALPAAPTWQVRDPLIAEVQTVDGHVVILGRAPGSTVVTATVDGDLARAALTVGPAEAVALELTPPRAAVVSGACATFTATLHYTDGRAVPLDGTTVAWGAGFPVQPDGRGGYCPFGTEGSFPVWASRDGLVGRATLDVALAPLIGLTVFGPLDVALGTDFGIDVQASFADGTATVVTDRVQWTSSAPAVLTPPAPGSLWHAAALGSVTLEASFGGRTASVDVEVRPARLTFLDLSPASATVAVGATTAFTATGFYDDGTSADVTAAATWTATVPARASVVAGVVTGVTPGGTAVRAELDGLLAFASVNVTP